jgi:hypothetical protein
MANTNHKNKETNMIRWALRKCIGLLATLTLASGVRAADLPTRDSAVKSQAILLDEPDWRIAVDFGNKGREEKWFEAVRPEAKKTPVPGAVIYTFPNLFTGGSGVVAWYWRSFEALPNPHRGGRYLFRFGAVDYKAEVWLNGQAVGGHEGGETPFTLDVTDAIRPGKENLLAVRVLDPGHPAIDGLTRENVRGRGPDMFCKGGIAYGVELSMVPAIRIADLHVIPDWKTGELRLKATLNNTAVPSQTVLRFSVAPANGGQTLASNEQTPRVETGSSHVEVVLRVPEHKLWSPEAPFLYRVTAGVQAAGSTSLDRQEVRCGFRDFRLENGYFRLNGQRIFLKGMIYYPACPITHTIPLDPELLRKDVNTVKQVGGNFLRVSLYSAPPRLIESCDEAGVLIVEENYLAWQSRPTQARWNAHVGELICRDRNHPSLVAWGLGNEGAPKWAATALPMIRELDQTRMVFQDSGGSRYANPGEVSWRGDVTDGHPYFEAPLNQNKIAAVRNHKRGWVSEAGFTGTLDLPSDLVHYKELGQEESVDGSRSRKFMNSFMADWKGWRLDEIWKRPEDYFPDAHRNLARVREPVETAWRSNPGLLGYCPTQAPSDGRSKPFGLTTTFREPKDPALLDGARLLYAPLRWCLFVTPNTIYSGSRVRFEAVVSDFDTLRPGAYPVRVEVLGPEGRSLLTREIQIQVGDKVGGQERSFVIPAFDEEIAVQGAAGTYEFVATMAGRQEIPGGRMKFYVDDPAAMPELPKDVVCWGEDARLTDWLTKRGVNVRPFDAAAAQRAVIVAGTKPPAAPGCAQLVRLVARGSTVIFLDRSLLMASGGREPRACSEKAAACFVGSKTLGRPHGHMLFRSERWVKPHPLFAGLPAGGTMDYSFYGTLISHLVYRERGTPNPPPHEPRLAEAICGSICINAEKGYISGLHIGVHELGAGRFILNTLDIAPNLGAHPAAERLLRNMLKYAARGVEKPLEDLPADLEKQLKAMGHE